MDAAQLRPGVGAAATVLLRHLEKLNLLRRGPVTLLPGARGRRPGGAYFDPNLVRIHWKAA